METSDSEYFESADEELYGDETDDSKETVSVIQDKLNNMNLQENSVTNNSKSDEIDFTNTSYALVDCNEIKTKNSFSVTEKLTGLHVVSTNQTKSITEACTFQKKEYLVQHLIEVKTSNTSGEVTEQEVLKGLIGENENKTADVNKELNPFTKLEKEPDESLQIENSIDENLWENDGWEIEDEIEVSSPITETLNTKDPLTISTENMWETQEWENVDEAQTQINTQMQQSSANTTKQITNDSWSSWGNWGVTSILSTATQSVSTITNHVSQGLSSVLETGIGIPPAEELAKMNLAEEKKANEFRVHENTQQSTVNVETDNLGNPVGYVFSNFGSLVSGVSNITKFVESTSTKVISGGLETLETIGKKTFEVLQEGDPGLKKKRAFLKLEQEKPILSQVLREAKEKAEQENVENENQTKQITKKVNYEALFDDYHGLVHLEALEMLSKQCELKLKTLCDNCSGDALIELQETMDQIKELCELPDEDEDEQLTLDEIREKLLSAVEDINVNITYEKLISSWEETEKWLESIKINICSDEELHHQAIETLAQLTALAVEQYHKAGELLLIKDHHSTADEADSLLQ